MSEAGALGAYLRDHMAGSARASDLASRVATSSNGRLGAFFSGLAHEIDVDQRTLGTIAAQVGAAGHPAELAGTAQRQTAPLVTGSGELGLLLELEALYLGIQGKQVLWRTLQAIAGNDQRLADFDFGRLRARAREQLDAVEEQRLRVAVTALRG